MLPEWTQLQHAFQEHMLPLLTAREIAGLRGTCTSFHLLIDQDSSGSILPALSQHMPPAQLPDPADSQAAQQRLRQHAACIRSVLAGDPSKVRSAEVLMAVQLPVHPDIMK